MQRPFLLSTLAVAMLAAFTFADDSPVVVVPKPEPAKWVELTGEFPLTRLSAAGDKPAKWELIDTVGAELEACESGKKASLVVSREGRYRLLLTTDAGSVRIAVTVGKPVPTPPDVPPSPVDPLIASLQAAYTADAGTTKAGQLAALAALYEAAVDLVRGSNPPGTTVELIGRLRQSAETLKVSGLDGMRKIIAAELKAVLPNDVPLTGDTKTAAVAVLARVRDALAKVK